MKESTTKVLQRITLETESRTEITAGEHRLKIAGEFFPNANHERLDARFYPEILRPRIHSCFEENTSSHLDYAREHVRLDEIFLQCNGSETCKFYRALVDPDAELLSGDFSQNLETILDLYDSLQQSEYCDQLMQQWADSVTASSATDIKIFELALREYDSHTINEELKLGWNPQEITNRIFQLQNNLLEALISGLHR